MKDFDFEEIDKAVAGALASDPVPTQTSVSDNTQSVDTVDAPKSEVVETPQPVRETIVEPEKPAIVQTPRTAPAARRSSGRFMDVVHPSSDMRGRTTFTPPAPQTAAPVEEPVREEPKETPESILAAQEDELEAWAKPLESPFLPGARVEKRPLGGIPSSIDATLEELLLDEPDELRIEAPNEPRLEAPDELRIEATSMPDPIDFAANSAVLSSEKEDTGLEDQPISEPVVGEITPPSVLAESSIHAELAAALAEESEKDTEIIEEQPVVEQVPVPEVPVQETPIQQAPVAPQQEPVGPTSISQQYTEQPSSAEAPGAIYDTEAYHQAVVPPVVKKKSGIWVVLWILLLVILGAGAGVVFYLFVLPLL